MHTIIERQYEPTIILTIDGACVQESVGEFKKLPEALRERIIVLKGHLYFGLHEFLPRPSTYITILRDPVDRVISNYYYVLRTPSHYLHHEIRSQGMSLREYLRSEMNPQLDNAQRRLLSGV